MEIGEGHAGLRRPAGRLERGPQRPLPLLPVRPDASRRQRSAPAPRCSTARPRSPALLAGQDGGAAQDTASTSPSAARWCSSTRAAWAWKASSPSSRTRPIAPAGRRAWLKSKCVDSDEFVIIGYVPSTTQRRMVGSLALGYYRQGQARLCRPRRLGLLGRGGRGPVAPAGADPHRRPRAGDRRRRPRRAATCAGPSRRWWPRWSCAAGRRTASCATPSSRGCARTSRPPMSPRRGPPCARNPQDRESRKSPKAATALPVAPHPSRPRAVARRGRDQAGAGRVLRRDLAVDRAARGRPAAGAGALPRRHRRRPASSRSTPGPASASTSSAAAIRRAARSCWPSRTSRGCSSLTQASVLEIHVWGARLDDIEKPDRHHLRSRSRRRRSAGRTWSRAALEVRDRLQRLGLDSFVKTTGGKGLHVFAPLQAACRLGRREGLRPRARHGHGQGQPAALPGDRVEGGAAAAASSSTICATAAVRRPSSPIRRGRGPAPPCRRRWPGTSWAPRCAPTGSAC